MPSHFYRFVLSLGIHQTKSSNSALFPRIILLLLSFLHLRVNLGISLPMKKNKNKRNQKTPASVLLRIVLNLLINLG